MESGRAMHPDDIPGKRYPIPSQQDEQLDEIEESVVHLLNLVIVSAHHTSEDGTRADHCQLCLMWSGQHTSTCPVPQLEDWLSSRYLDHTQSA